MSAYILSEFTLIPHWPVDSCAIIGLHLCLPNLGAISIRSASESTVFQRAITVILATSTELGFGFAIVMI